MARKSSRKTGEPSCPICRSSLGPDYDPEAAGTYPGLVCRTCDRRAVDVSGAQPEHDGEFDGGSNPVFIDGKKCWRRYRFGGFVTMLDTADSPSFEAFFDRTFRR